MATDPAIALSVQGLRFSYPGCVPLFEGAGFELRRGSVSALVGPNGAGKTTLMDILCGLTPLKDGRVSYHGGLPLRSGFGPEDVARLELRVRRCFQIPVVVEELSVRENVLLGKRGRSQDFLKQIFGGRRGDDKDSLADSLSGTWDLFSQLHAKANEAAGALSFGEKKMVDLARALHSGAEMLLLDEPFANLHAELVEPLIAVIRNWGGTVLMIEHSLEKYLGFVDRVLEIRDRVIVDSLASGMAS